MPPKKPVPSLYDLCVKSFLENLSTLQHTAKRLPLPIIDDLHDKSIQRYIYLFSERNLLPPLSTDLFIHARTKKIHDYLNFYDRPVDEVLDKISQLCKNLRQVRFIGNVDHIITTIINNPTISVLDLCNSQCTNQHLAIISKQCPQLQDLLLCGCDSITDEGMNYLPRKLVTLCVPFQITLKGQLNALEQLLHLKSGPVHRWNDIIEALAESRMNRFHNRTYLIEEIGINISRLKGYYKPGIIKILFPKLAKVWLGYCLLGSEVGDFLTTINCNLLTELHVETSPDFIQTVGHLCPMLQVLDIRVLTDRQMANDQYLAETQNLPFKYLSKLDLSDMLSKLTTNDLKFLLGNCHELESLTISHIDLLLLLNQIIYDKNPLKCVKSVTFNNCGPFRIESLCLLLETLDSLRNIIIRGCRHLSLDDKKIVEELINKRNWSVRLNWKRQKEVKD